MKNLNFECEWMKKVFFKDESRFFEDTRNLKFVSLGKEKLVNSLFRAFGEALT